MPSGEHLPAKKPTGWMSNSDLIKETLEATCPGLHRHGSLWEGRSKQCNAYPPKIVSAVLCALRKELRRCGRLD
eukprot:15058412-Heterocapsa_arctica.AAC.1